MTGWFRRHRDLVPPQADRMATALRDGRARMSDAELRSAIAGAWRRIEARTMRQAASAPRPLPALHRAWVPVLAALACFLIGFVIGAAQRPAGYESALSDLARHPILAELDP